MRTRTWLAAGWMVMTAGCRTVEFYGQAVTGQIEVLAKRVPAADVAAQTEDGFLKERLELTRRLLVFARDELHMPSQGNYELYADLHRKHLVWVLHAAPELSMEPRSWWYPVVGRQDYRGFFREHPARAEAAMLEAANHDTWVDGVDAYSTLGWFRDPVLNTFVGRDELDYAELIFHELAHVKHYERGNTSWNEGMAEAVAREGVRRWCAHTGRPQMAREYETRLEKRAQARGFISGTAEALRKIYGQPASDDQKRAAKHRELARLKRNLQALSWRWGGGLKSWIDGPVNNARLNAFTTYEAEVPKFEALLNGCGGDFREFWRRLKELEP
ncbi:MAG: aminopeptidase [Akkermansiaceae bacterium]|nr:aminopeptidase [Akkermansiaceae bacterium]